MQIGNKFRCYPTKVQAQILLQWIGCQRHIYNAKVKEDRYFRSFARQSLNHAGQYAPIDQQYAQFKTELTPFLSDVPSPLLRNGAVLWKQAYSRYFAKLGGRPTLHKKHGKQSVWLTSELFQFVPFIDQSTGEIQSYQLHLGTKKYPVGIVDFKANRNFKHGAFKIPATIHLSIHAGRWHVSFNYDDGNIEPSEKEITAYLKQFSFTELQMMAVGLDRGVNIPLASSDGSAFGLSEIQQKRIAKQEQYKTRWQRRLARRTKGSSGWLKAKRRIANSQRYAADVRHDFAHQVSHALVAHPQHKLFVFEALKVKNMTKRAKPKQDASGRFINNGAKAKSGLNKSILESVWGKTKTFTQYKAIRQGKLVIEVPPFHSSQECAACGFIHQDNRLTQAEFVCLSCGHQDHADYNAAKVIKQRGITKLQDNDGKKQDKKRIGNNRTMVGTGRSEPLDLQLNEDQVTPSETQVNRESGNTIPFWSLTSEPPARRPIGV